MRGVAGQISLFGYMLTNKETADPPILLHEGQKVYKVIRGDVEESIVTGEKSWICGENNRGYRLKRCAGGWDVTWNNSIGINTFTNLQEAKEKANNYLAKNNCILAENIKAKEVVAYRYLYDGREIIQYYAVLDDEAVYFHYASQYRHIGKKKEIIQFEKDREKNRKREEYEEIEYYQPVFANMYKCKNDSWIYAEAKYQYLDL